MKEEQIIYPFQMPKSMKEHLEEIARSEDRSVASVVRKAIKQYFEQSNKGKNDNHKKTQ